MKTLKIVVPRRRVKSPGNIWGLSPAAHPLNAVVRISTHTHTHTRVEHAHTLFHFLSVESNRKQTRLHACHPPTPSDSWGRVDRAQLSITAFCFDTADLLYCTCLPQLHTSGRRRSGKGGQSIRKYEKEEETRCDVTCSSLNLVSFWQPGFLESNTHWGNIAT